MFTGIGAATLHLGISQYEILNLQSKLNPSDLKLIGTSPNLWELKLVGLNSHDLRSFGEGNLLKPFNQFSYSQNINNVSSRKRLDSSNLPDIIRNRFVILVSIGEAHLSV